MLLRFRVANHRSIRDEQTLSLVAVPRRGEAKPPAGTIPPTLRVSGIYGANASGKSNVLNALAWMLYAIRSSQTQWAPDQGIPRSPFKLSPEAAASPSFFEIDFVYHGIRYSYGFEVNESAVLTEWLNSFPHGRTRKLFVRTDATHYEFGRSLTGELSRIANLTRENSLYLSSAAVNNHRLLGALHQELTRHIRFSRQSDADEHARLRTTRRMLSDPEVSPRINEALRIADLGIESAEIVEREIDPEIAATLRRMHTVISGSTDVPDSILDDLRYEIRLSRKFSKVALDLREESAGTRVWLSMIGPIFMTLRNGDVLVVDEIDSSLHPLLSSTLIRIFKDPEVNRKGAQLIFASHDTTLLGSLLDDELLDRDEVWFTEKDDTGATSLYSLAEFHPRRDENIERGYLQGRYGAVPYVNFEKIREIFQGWPTEPTKEDVE